MTPCLTRRSFLLRRFRHDWRGALLLGLLAALGGAVVTGALFVGDSVRGSLARRAQDRLGEIRSALTAPGVFRTELAGSLERELEKLPGSGSPSVVALLGVDGAVTAAASGSRAGGVRVLGVPDEHWRFWPSSPEARGETRLDPEGRTAWINDTLAAELELKVGESLLLHLRKASDLPADHALGRRSGDVRATRLEVAHVLSGRGPGLFDLESSQLPAKLIYVPRSLLARLLGREGLSNTLLTSATVEPSVLEEALARVWSLEDAGLRLRSTMTRVGELGHDAVLESRGLLLPSSLVPLALGAAKKLSIEAVPALTYMATSITLGDRSIPYSTVTAVAGIAGEVIPPGKVVLGSWAAERLGARPGQRIGLTYFSSREGGALEEVTVELELVKIVPLAGEAADPSWTPEYPGVTNARSLRAWDPPFPVDKNRIQPEDESYWTDHSTTPKAFLSLEDGRRLWGGRFGDTTGIRLQLSRSAGDSEQLQAAFAAELRSALRPSEVGLAFRPVLRQALEAAKGGTDFGGLFLGFSFFLIASALALVGMVFRLSCERRAPELGLLKAVGLTPRGGATLLLLEGALVGGLGLLAGPFLGLGYAALLVWGLRTLWAGAVNAPFLAVDWTWTSVVAGTCGSGVVVAGVLAGVARRVARTPAVSLLCGRTAPGPARSPTGARRALRWALSLLSLGLLLLALGGLGRVSLEIAFFAGGAAMLTATLAGFLAWLRWSRPGAMGPRRLLVLGIENARRAPGRSLLTAGLIAAATFLLVAVAASRRDAGGLLPDLRSGNGGFALVASSAIPLHLQPGDPSSWEALGLEQTTRDALAGARVFSLRVRDGDEASCLNLYRPLSPRLLGVPKAFRERGGFSWSNSLARTPEEVENPWKLLERDPATLEGALPVVADANTAQWILHVSLGEDLTIADDSGKPVKLRLVATLGHSIFQGELVAAEESFLRAFPLTGGYRRFLIEPAGDRGALLAQGLEADLEEVGFDLESTGTLLAGYQAVENTYLSTFQLLGGLGLLLGVCGLAVILLRTVHERQGELALLRAVGASRRGLVVLVLAETCALLAAGLTAGAASAVLAVLPAALGRQGNIPWGGLAATLAAIATAGGLASILAVRRALSAPLVPALRKD